MKQPSIPVVNETHPLSSIPMNGPQFDDVLSTHKLALRRGELSELQINLGKLCNLACHHCHVDAGPKRTEIMTWQTMQNILAWIDQASIKAVDLTGGAPELNPHFRQFCNELLDRSIQITSRCNITVLFEPGQEDLAEYYAANKIRLVCSLPCYTEDNVDAQRGKGVFDKSIQGLQKLNALGYGIDSSLPLDLVYNPGGAFLPPPQAKLEADYRAMLKDNFGIEFSHLLALTNLPVNRFAHALRREHQLDEYQQLLVDSFNPATIEGLMCRHLINVDWQGLVFDCDFNQMLDLHMNSAPTYLWDVAVHSVKDRAISTDRHCFGCSAGSGSSCSGVLT